MREYKSKFDSRLYSIQNNDDVKQRGVKLQGNKKLFPSLSVLIGEIDQYIIKGVIRSYRYR